MRDRLRDVRGVWERISALLCTAAAGFLVAEHPAASIDRLVGGYPATLLLGLILGVGAVLNLIGLMRPSYTLQRFGLLLQIPVLVLFTIALAAIAASGGLGYGLLLLALSFRLVGQYRRLGRHYEVTQALVKALDDPPAQP